MLNVNRLIETSARSISNPVWMDGLSMILENRLKKDRLAPLTAFTLSTATDMAENLESNSMPASSAEEKINNGYGHR